MMKIAALTMVFNERHFLPIWIHHYGSALGRENLYVVDDGSDDGSTTGLGQVKVLRGKKSILDESERVAKIAAIQAELLTQYDAVVVSDVDELLVVDPALGKDFAEYIDTRIDTVATAAGLNVQFSMFSEKPLVAGRSLFLQRQYVQFDWGYCKTLVSRIPLQWTPGFHGPNVPISLRPDLFLFHLRSVDPDISLGRLKSFNRIQRSQAAIEAHHSDHFKATEEEYLRTFYFTSQRSFERAIPKSEFDSTLLHLLDLYRNSEVDALNVAAGQLMLLPDRFAHCITIPKLQR
jgi:hypothetical protein